jgi:peptidoglycan/LPS O-acetylase OafA/YrhL
LATKINYRPEIDGLRAIAVAAVVCYHAGFGPVSGFAGVDIFFVISGYLITSILRAEIIKTGRIEPISFYARRIRRLFPALLVVICFTLTFGYLTVPAFEIKSLFDSAAACLLFVANIYFQFTAGGYFDPSADRMPFLHMWSLGVEEQFYLLWPAVICFLAAVGKKKAFAAVLCGIAGSLIVAEILMYLQPDAAFYEMPARFWELCSGSLIAFTRKQNLHVGIQRGLLAMAAALIVTGLFTANSHFPGVGAIPAVLSAALLIYVIHHSTKSVPELAPLRSKLAVGVGLISYPFYLWHWPLLVLLNANEQPATLRIAICLVAAVLAAITYRYVELPARTFILGVGNQKIVVRGCLISLISAVTFMATGKAFDEFFPVDLATRTFYDYPANRNRCHYRGDEQLGLVPRPNCESAKGKPIRVVIWGDSHALAWQPLAWAMARQEGAAAISLTRDSCAPILDYHNGKRPLEDERCRTFNKLAFDWIVDNAASINTLVVTALWQSDIVETDSWRKFQETIKQVAPKIQRIIILGPTPYLPKPVPECISQKKMPECFEAREAFDAAAFHVKRALTQLAYSTPNVKYVDLADFFCDEEICPAIKDGYGLYWDSNHVSTTAATKFAEQHLSDLTHPATP